MHRNKCKTSVLICWVLAMTPSALCTGDEGIQFFEQKIRPLLIAHCYECHSEGAEKLKGGLLLDSSAGWHAGGDSGDAVIVPGQPDSSPLISLVRHENGNSMPPDKKLSDMEIADLITWVKMGAPDPRVESTPAARRADKSWWSLQPLTKLPPPDLKMPIDGALHPDNFANWGSNPIDRFIAETLNEHKLVPNPPAGPRALVRRMSYDVLGLPPTPAEVRAFAEDFARDQESAVASLVDRLLASPHYGEQWGRHWLDVVRFGESIGFERNVINDDLWPFRDYVIDSINRDKPFNRFIVEHLAGDVIPDRSTETEIASAFLVAGPYDDVGNQDVVAQANIRAATLDDMITATGTAFLGLSINCARCHNHKFDPIPTEDYYRLRSAFEGIEHGKSEVASAVEREQFDAATLSLNQEKQTLNAELAEVEKSVQELSLSEVGRRTHARPKFDPQWSEERFAPIRAQFVKLSMLAHTGNAHTAVGSRLVEVEVWTSDARNVALQSAGGTAEGAKAATAEDFPQAYAAPFTNDGTYAEQWFVGSPAELQIRFAQPETIERLSLANSRGIGVQSKGIQGETPCEYEVLVSLDGNQWQRVADTFDREPWNGAHAVERLHREMLLRDEDHEPWQQALRAAYLQLTQLRKKINDVQRKLNAVPPLQQVWVGKRTQPKEPTRVHLGGDPMKPGEVVVPASLEVLDAVSSAYQLPADAAEGERRLALAKWIVADDNPLTARVLANRVWHYHFGTGIVDTPSDFGFLGGSPSHPKLLDWMAGQLQAGGWRLKSLHRQILLSQTYRQSSKFRDAAAAVDKDARLLWRFPPRRLSAEELRDTMLSLSGVLSTQSGGPGFRLYKFTQNNVCTYFPLDEHGPDTYRRAVYHQNARASVVDLLTDFDFPDNSSGAPRRANTTSPMQTLTMLNHKFTMDMAQALAARAEMESVHDEVQAVVGTIYQLALQRDPDPVEIESAVALIQHYDVPTLCRAVLNLNELLYLE